MRICLNIVTYLTAKHWSVKLLMNSKSQVPCIPIDKPISWEDWLRGRKARRESSKLVAPGNLRRESSSKDRRLRKLFNGERGLPFTPTDKL